jgi:dihydrofolate reductase
VSARLSIIAAVAENGVIGRAGGLPWRLPDDLRRFKELTMGKPVVMGRRTWESLRRPLPGRQNIVVSRNLNYAACGAEVCSSLDAALARAGEAAEIFVIGGASLYAEALPRAQRLYLTEVHASVEGDAFFPAWDRNQWVETSAMYHPIDAHHPIAFTLRILDAKHSHTPGLV